MRHLRTTEVMCLKHYVSLLLQEGFSSLSGTKEPGHPLIHVN